MATAMEVVSLLQRPRGIQDWWKEIEESMHVRLHSICGAPFQALPFESLGGNSNSRADQPGVPTILSFSESLRELRSPIHRLFSPLGSKSKLEFSSLWLCNRTVPNNLRPMKLVLLRA
jgi:hypothetical protein